MADETVRTPELDNVKKATAMMFAALVDTLVGTDSPQAARFAEALNKVYTHIRDDSADLNALELVLWTRSMIIGFDTAEGQKDPLMKSR